MLNLKFENELPTTKSENTAEAFGKLPQYSYQNVPLRSISINLTGKKATIKYEKVSFGITQWAYKNLLKYVGISFQSASIIHIDILNNLINDLIKRISPSLNILLVKRENSIVNIGNPGYFPIKHEKILQIVKEKCPDEFNNVMLNDRGLTLSILNKNVTPIEPKVGDIINTCVSLHNSVTLGEPISLNTSLHRLVCSNGTILKDKRYSFKPEADRVRSYYGSIYNLFDDIRKVSLKNVDHLRSQLSKIHKEKLFDQEFICVWDFLTKFLNTEKVDSILNTKMEDRKALKTIVSKRKKRNATMSYKNRELPTQTTYGLYDAFNTVTEIAKNANYQDSLKLQMFGGDMLFWRNN